MGEKGRRRPCRPALLGLCLGLLLGAGCGEGWDAYAPFYAGGPAEDPGEPWSGPERVFVDLGEERLETFLDGIMTTEFRTGSGAVIAAVLLSDFIDASGVTSRPEAYRYDFTASDGYNLLRKRGGDLSELPAWDNLRHGYFYRGADAGGLTVGWDEAKQPWGSAVSAYNLKYMDGGVITLLEP